MNMEHDAVPEKAAQEAPDAELIPPAGTVEQLRAALNSALYGLQVHVSELISRKLDISNELRTEQAAQARELAFIRKTLASHTTQIRELQEKNGIVPPSKRRRNGKGPRLPEAEGPGA